MKTKTKQILATMRIIAWVIFIGLCIQTGTVLYSFFVSLVINPEGAKNLDLGLNLSGLYSYSTGYYIIMVLLVICLSGLKAYTTYLVIKIFLKINFVHPFSPNIALLIKTISYVSLGIGILALTTNACSEWLIKKGVTIYTLQQYAILQKLLGGGAEFLFFGGIIFIIALVFNRGIEMQSENELTV